MTNQQVPEALQHGISGPSGFHPIETAPKDGTRILLHPALEVHDAWSKGYWSEQNECWIVGGSPSGVLHTAWHPLPPPPTSAEGWSMGERVRNVPIGAQFILKRTVGRIISGETYV